MPKLADSVGRLDRRSQGRRRIGVDSHGLYNQCLRCMSKITEVIAELRDEQARLKLELSRIERVLEALEGTLGSDRRERAAPAAPAPAAAEPPPEAKYAQWDLYEATTLYLAYVGEPKTARQIADALRAGGFKTRSRDFAGTVRTMLRRRPTRGIRVTSDGKRWVYSGAYDKKSEPRDE
jgi:hypothetical protein